MHVLRIHIRKRLSLLAAAAKPPRTSVTHDRSRSGPVASHDRAAATAVPQALLSAAKAAQGAIVAADAAL